MGDPRRACLDDHAIGDDFLPTKPFPMEDVIQTEIENMAPTIPEFRGKKAADFVDKTILSDLDREGFFTQLASKYGK